LRHYLSRIKAHKPASNNHHSNKHQSFVQQTALTAGQKSAGKDNQSESETTSDIQSQVQLNPSPFGVPFRGEPFVPSTVFGQPKLNIGKPNDKYEVEADRVADKVVEKSNTEAPKANVAPPPVQTKDSGGAEESEGVKEEVDVQAQEIDSKSNQKESDQSQIQEKPISENITTGIQLKPIAQTDESEVQKKEEDTEGETEVQAKLDASTDASEKIQKVAATDEESNDLQKKNEGAAGGGNDVESSLKSSKGNGSAMDDNTRSSMESGFGADFSGVRIHTDSNAVQMNKSLGSQAFANGSDVYFNEGKYNPSSKDGQHLLAHELTHTVQQGASGTKVQKQAADGEMDYGTELAAEQEKIAAPEAPAQTEAPAEEASSEESDKMPYPGDILQNNDGPETIQRSVSDFGHSEDGDGPMRAMDEKRREEGIESSDAESNEPDSDAERPDQSELREKEGEIGDDAKPSADRDAENAPKIEEKAAKVDEKVEEGGEVEGAETKNEAPPEQKPEKSPAETAKANAIGAFDKSQTFAPPPSPVDVKDPTFQTPKDSAGEELPVNPANTIKTAAISTQIKLYRERAFNLKTGAVAEKAKAEELRGSIEIGKSGVHESNEVIGEFKLHSQARRENVEDIESHIVEANRRADMVAEKAPELKNEAVEGSSETSSMAEESSDQQGNVESIPNDPESNDENRRTADQLESTQGGAESADSSMKQMAEVNDQLQQEAIEAKQRNTETSVVLTQAHENITAGEEKLQADTELNIEALGKFEEMSSEPDAHIAKATAQEASADDALRESMMQEEKMHSDLQWYYDNLAKTPARPNPEDYDTKSDSNDAPVIQRAVFSGNEEQENGLSMEDAERFNEDATARQEFLDSIENGYQRRLAENELEMIRDFDQMDLDDRQWYALGVAWNQLMAGVTENGFSGFLKDALAVAFWPPATAEFMWHLMWPDTTNDPWWAAGLRYAAGWTSAAAVAFGALWSLSLAGFLLGSLLTLFVFTAPVGGPMVAVFGPLMTIFGALFEMAAYISTLFHLLTLTYDLHQAGNAENSVELSETSDQVADDVQRGMVAYLGTAAMFMGPYIGAVLGKTPLGRWWGNFKTWFEARQLRVQQIRNAEVTPPQGNGAPNPEGDLVAGSEFNGEGIRMNEQPFEGNNNPVREAEVTPETGYAAELTTRKGTLQTQLESVKGSAAEVETTINQRTGNAQGEFAENLRGANERLQQIQQEINVLERDIAAAESQNRLSKLEDRLNELRNEIEGLSSEVTGSHGMRRETSNAIERLENLKHDPLGEVNAEPNKNHYNAARIEARNEPLLQNGEPVLRPDGSPYSHIRDLQNAHDALVNVRTQLELELQDPLPGLSDSGIEILFDRLAETNRLINRVRGFLNEINWPPSRPHRWVQQDGIWVGEGDVTVLRPRAQSSLEIEIARAERTRNQIGRVQNRAAADEMFTTRNELLNRLQELEGQLEATTTEPQIREIETQLNDIREDISTLEHQIFLNQ